MERASKERRMHLIDEGSGLLNVGNQMRVGLVGTGAISFGIALGPETMEKGIRQTLLLYFGKRTLLPSLLVHLTPHVRWTPVDFNSSPKTPKISPQLRSSLLFTLPPSVRPPLKDEFILSREQSRHDEVIRARPEASPNLFTTIRNTGGAVGSGRQIHPLQNIIRHGNTGNCSVGGGRAIRIRVITPTTTTTSSRSSVQNKISSPSDRDQLPRHRLIKSEIKTSFSSAQPTRSRNLTHQQLLDRSPRLQIHRSRSRDSVPQNRDAKSSADYVPPPKSINSVR